MDRHEARLRETGEALDNLREEGEMLLDQHREVPHASWLIHIFRASRANKAY